MGNRDTIVIEKILNEAKLIAEITDGYTREMFISDEKTKRAVCMTLINIGELVKLLSEDIKTQNKHIPWRSIAGLRDVTAHGYQTLRMEDIWITITTDVITLHKQLRELLQSN